MAEIVIALDALYSIDQAQNRIVILAIRHQREAGYDMHER